LPLLITPAIIDIIDIIINIDAATPLLLILIDYITPHYIIIIDWRHITLRHIDITPLTLATLLTTLHYTLRHYAYAITLLHYWLLLIDIIDAITPLLLLKNIIIDITLYWQTYYYAIITLLSATLRWHLILHWYITYYL
jgi:hypothetical protein